MLKHLLNLVVGLAFCASVEASPHSYIEVDSVTNNLQDFDYLTSYTEANYVAFPAIINGGFGEQYRDMKMSLRDNVASGDMGIKKAACEYVYWFNSGFDAHYYVDEHLFWKVYKRKDTPDYRSLMEYNPQKLSTRVDKQSWLIRVPSCTGENPTFEWVANAVEEFQKSKCKNLIIDLRGNSGGSDEIWTPLFSLLIDHKALIEEEYWFRNTYDNIYNNPMHDWLVSNTSEIDNADKAFLMFGPGDGEDDEEDEIPEHDAGIHISFIIDRGTASSAETILRIAKNFTSRERYTIYGKENSAGAAETGNLMPFHLPHSRIQLFYPVVVSSVFLSSEQYNGASGIQPDVKIELPYPEKLTDNIDSWVLYVARRSK